MTHFKTLLLTLTSVSIAQTAFAQNATPFQAQKMAHDLMRLNSGLLHGQQQQYRDVFGRIGSRFEMPEVNSELVRRHEQKFAKESAYLNRTIKRSEPYLHHVATEVERRNMPGEIALLPFIESAFVIKAKSPVGASGLWQFMPATGKDFGLDQNHVYDGRHDVYAATDAALNYLEYLYGLFGDWSLALAAYNWGQGNVSRAIKRAEAQGLLPTYENLRMPQETRNYAPKLLAWRNIVHNPAAFGLQLPHIADEAYFQAVDLTTPIDTAAAARLAGISHEEFLRLNPGFNLPVFIPTASRKMLLPKHSVKQFVKNYENSKIEDLLTYNVYTPMRSEKASDVAASFGMTESELRQINGLRGSNLSTGLPVLVAKNRAPLVNNAVLTPSDALESGLNLLQVTSHSLHQADQLGKPQAQLATATPLKVRASRSAPNMAYNFVQNTPVMTPTAIINTPVTSVASAVPSRTSTVPLTDNTVLMTASAKPAEIKASTTAIPVVNNATINLPETPTMAAKPAITTLAAATTADFSPAQISVPEVDNLSPAVEKSVATQVASESLEDALNAPIMTSNSIAASQSLPEVSLAVTDIPTVPDEAVMTLADAPSLVSSAMPNVWNNMGASTAQQATLQNTEIITAAAITTPEVNLLAAPERNAGDLTKADPLLNLMSQHSSGNAQLKDNHAAESVRAAIARENEREAREEARLAKVRAEAEKRERQLANANEHKVTSGETLYSIARLYDMQVSQLLAANGLADSQIQVGQTLKVGKAADKAIQLAQAKETRNTNPKNTKKPTKSETKSDTNYVVRKGDTLVSIAGKFNVKVNDLKKWNNTDSNLKPGQKLKLRQL